MRRVFTGLMLALLLGCPALAQQGRGTPVSVRGEPSFADARTALGGLVRHKGRSGRNSFCVVGYREEGAVQRAWIHWRENHTLILWEGGDPLQSRSTIDLLDDVVPTERDVHGSTYIVSRPWVDAVQRDCRAHGDRYVLRRP